MGSNMWNISGFPGVGSSRTATPRKLALNDELKFRGPGLVIDGTLSNDAGNAADITELRVGKLMGRVTTGGKYAPSILGVTTGANANTATTLAAAATTVTELARRMGASGTLKLTGPATANGVARTRTATYSAASGTSITITALGVNEVQTITITGTPTGGTFRLGFLGQWTTPLAYNVATADMQTALNALSTIGAAGVAVTGTPGTTYTVTWSGTAFAYYPVSELVKVDATGMNIATTSGNGATNEVITHVITAAATTGGNYFLWCGNKSTTLLAYNANQAAIQAALDTAFGSSAIIVASSTNGYATQANITYTFSGTGYVGRPITEGFGFVPVIPLTALAMSQARTTPGVAAVAAASNSATVGIAQTVAGVDGRFVAGSFIQPVDGSETIMTITGGSPSNFDAETTDRNGAKIDTPFALPVIGGSVDVGYIVDYPTDTGLIAYVKAALRANSVGYHFSDDF